MAGITQQQNLLPNEPTLKDLLDLVSKNIMLNFSAHHIGTVQSFNPLLQTATATINYQKTFFKLNSITGTYRPTLVSYPLLLDCPVICLGGGGRTGGSLTFPISTGDECLLLFNDRDFDNWFAGSSTSGVATARLHSFSDAIILVGVRSLPNVLLNYDSSRVVLSNTGGLTKVAIGSTQIEISNLLNGTLGKSFTSFFAALQVFMTAASASVTDPVLAAAAAAFSTAMAVPVPPSALGPIVNIEGILK